MSARLWIIAAVAALGACATDIEVDPEGFRCDPGGVCPAGYRCVDDVCRNEANVCEGVVCNAPPSASCKDASTLTTFASTGSCDPLTGACTYSSSERTCAMGCQDGACVGEDPCANVTCNAPPAPTCLDGSTLRTFGQVGACTQGACDYPPTDITCQNGCKDGMCEGQDLCQNVTCNTPPPPTCSGNTKVTYAAMGTCNMGTGMCTYAEQTEACAGSCAAGVCVAPSKTFTAVGPRLDSPVTAADIGPTSFGNSVVVVGPKGFVARWDGMKWTTLPSGTSQDLLAVWLSSNDEGYIVGKGGTALRLTAQGLSPLMLNGASGDLVSVHGKGTQVLIASASGDAWRSGDGTTFSRVTASGLTISQVTQAFVNADGSERLAGACSTATVVQPCVSFSSSGTATSWYTDKHTTAALSGPFTAVGPSHETSSAYITQGTQVVRHTNGGAFQSTSISGISGVSVVGITRDETAATSTLFYLTEAGNGVGYLLRQPSAQPAVKLLPLYGTHQALSRNFSGGVVVVDGISTASNIFRRGAVTDEALELGGVSFVAADQVLTRRVFINAFADIAVHEPTRNTFRFDRSPSVNADFQDVVAASTYALVVGKGGSYFKWSPTTWFVGGTVSGAGDLNAGCRNSDTEVYVVGSAGKIYRYDGATFTPMNSGTTQALNDVVCTGSGEAFAVGTGGTVLSLSGGTWSPVAPALGGSADLRSVWASADGALFVAGPNTFARHANNAWASLSAKSALDDLLGVSTTEIYATNGKDVVRFDGSNWTTVFSAQQNLVAGTTVGQTLTYVGPAGTIVEGR